MVRRRIHALAAALVALAACGPVTYVGDVTRKANDAVAAARAVQAEKYAPYWWTRATQYLHQARVEAAAADFQAANRFGRLAAEAADQARDEALHRAATPNRKPELAPIDEPPAPAATDATPAEGDKPAEVTP